MFEKLIKFPFTAIMILTLGSGVWNQVYAQEGAVAMNQPERNDNQSPREHDHSHDLVNKFNLEEAIQFALINNKTLQNATLQQYISKQEARELVAQGYPQLDGKIDMTYYGNLPVNILPGELNTVEPGKPIELQFGAPWNANAGLGLSQLVFDGVFFLGLKASKVYVELSRKDKNRTAEDIAVKVSQAYFQAMVYGVLLDVIDANIERTAKLLSETEAMFKEGFSEKIDVERLQISATNLELERTRTERMADLSKDMLKFQMGMPVEEDILLTEDIQALQDQPVVGEGLLTIDPEKRIEYQVLQTQAELEDYNRRRFNAEYWPSIYGFGNYNFNAQRQEFNFFDSNESWFPISTFGFNMKIPIFDGFARASRVQQSKLAQQQIQNNMTDMRNSINLEVRNARATLLNDYNNLESYRKTMELSKEVLRVSDLKYKEGIGSSLEVNDADSQFKTSQANYLNGFFDYLQSRISYQKAIGEYSRYHLD